MSRRTNRRRLLKIGGTAGLLAATGCLGFKGSTTKSEPSTATEADGVADEATVTKATEATTEDESTTAPTYSLDESAWTSYRGDPGNTGYAPTDSPTDDVEVAWKLEMGGEVQGPPVFGFGNLYVGSWGGDFYAVDPDTGDVQWEYDASDVVGGAIDASPTLAVLPTEPTDDDEEDVARGPTVFLGTTNHEYDGGVVALDATSGEVQWEHGLSAAVEGHPFVADDTLFAGNSTAYVNAFDPASGEERWGYEGDRESPQNYSPVAYGNGTCYVGLDRKLVALDAADGTRLWENVEVSRPVVADGTVYAASETGDRILALDAESGAEQWRFSEDQLGPRAVAVANETVYVAGGGTEEQVVALKAGTADERWRVPLETDPNSAPTVTDDTVYLSAGETVRALDASDGSERWTHEFRRNDNVHSTHPVVDGTVYVGTDEGNLYALSEPV